MGRRTDKTEFQSTSPFWASTGLFLFGLVVLTFLVAIENVEWFRLHPLGDTTAATSYTSDVAPRAANTAL